MNIVLSIANQKGGVGKTTTCVNIGTGLARRGAKVLLIDFDPQASLSHFLKLDGSDLALGNIGDWMMGRASFDQVVFETPFAGMSVVRSAATLTGDETHIALNRANLSDSDGMGQYKVLQKAIDTIRDRFDYIVIDTPPTFSLLFTNAIFATDQVIIPTKMEFLSIRALGPLLARISEIKTYRPHLDVMGIVGTLYRVKVKEQAACLEDVRGKIPEGLFRTLVRQNVTLAESATFGKPIQFFDSQSPGHRDYEALTLEVIERCEALNLAAVR